MAIHFDDYVIYSPVIQVLEVIKSELAARGTIRFNTIKQLNNNVMTNCPFHSGGFEKKPSFGISEQGECHCFACGYSTKYFPEFVSNVFSVEDRGAYGKEWLLSHILSSPYQQVRDVNFDFLDRNIDDKSVSTNKFISEEELDSYRYIHPYMYKRHLTDKIIEDFDVGYDKSRDCITFPVKDLDGNVIFVATRSVNSKFFTLPESQEKPVYAANLFTSGKYDSAVICESILNTLTCWKLGLPSMALMGTGTVSQIKVLSNLPVYTYYLALDPDNAGDRGCNRIYRMLTGRHSVYRYTLPAGQDVNDLDEKFLTIKPQLYLGF